MNFAKFLRTTFLQNTSGRLLLLLAFQKQPFFYENVLLKISQNSQENSFCFEKFSKNLFYRTDCKTARLLLLLAFQKQPPERFYEKMCSGKFRKIQRKTPLLCKFSKTPFLQNTSGRLVLAFLCNVTKMGYCQQCLENLK